MVTYLLKDWKNNFQIIPSLSAIVQNVHPEYYFLFCHISVALAISISSCTALNSVVSFYVPLLRSEKCFHSWLTPQEETHSLTSCHCISPFSSLLHRQPWQFQWKRGGSLTCFIALGRKNVHRPRVNTETQKLISLGIKELCPFPVGTEFLRVPISQKCGILSTSTFFETSVPLRGLLTHTWLPYLLLTPQPSQFKFLRS